MSAVATAIIGSTLLGSEASGNAADAQLQGSRESAAAQERMFAKQTELQEPFRQAGLTSQNRLMELLGIGGDKDALGYGKYARDFGMTDFQEDPGYAFRLSEGSKALDRQAAARGGLISGSALKGALRFGQDMGSQEYTNAFNRYQTNRSNQLNPLQSLMGSGQTATNTLTNAAGNLGAAEGANAVNAANARASSYIGQANAMNQGLSSYLAYQQNQNLINRLPVQG
jgi:hypothetical protein